MENVIFDFIDENGVLLNENMLIEYLEFSGRGVLIIIQEKIDETLHKGSSVDCKTNYWNINLLNLKLLLNKILIYY